MAFNRPTLAELVDRIQQDFVSRMSLAGAVLRRSLVYVLSRVFAGAAHMLHGHLEFLARQLFPDTSEAEFLERQGALFGITRNAPEFATGNLTITGTNGTVIPIGTVFLRSDDTEYTTDAEVTISAGTATAALTAVVAADAGNCDAGTVLEFESPISGADASPVVAVDGLAGGTDEETDEDYRIRILERMRSPPHGGAEADYIAWAKEVSGVTRVWVYPLEGGAGTVTIRFTRDNDVSPIPSGGEVTAVQAHIDEVRPVTADVTVVAPIAAPVAFTIAVVPNTTAVKAFVQAELEDLLQRVAEPGEDLLLSAILTAIGTAEDVTDFTLTVPAADVTHATGYLATMGVITWV